MWLWKLNSRRMLLTKVLFVLFNQLMVIGIYGKLCETETGQNNIILDIEESRGDGEFHNFFPFSSAASHRPRCLTHTRHEHSLSKFSQLFFFYRSRDIWYSRQVRAKCGAAINNEPENVFSCLEICASEPRKGGKNCEFQSSTHTWNVSWKCKFH